MQRLNATYQSPSTFPPIRCKFSTRNISMKNKGHHARFQGSDTLNLGDIQVEIIESGENQTPDLPTNGYLVTHTKKNVSILHTGDLHEPYPALANLRGKVDFLIHMKLGIGDGLAPRLIALIRLNPTPFHDTDTLSN